MVLNANNNLADAFDESDEKLWPTNRMVVPPPGDYVIKRVTLRHGLVGQIETCGAKHIRWIIFNDLHLLYTGRDYRGIQSISIENAINSMGEWIDTPVDESGRTNGEKYEVKHETQDMFQKEAVAV